MQFSNEFIAKWEHIINSVDMTRVPLDCVKKIVIKLHNKRQRTINFNVLRKQGLELEEIELVLSRTLSELGDQVQDFDFVVDVGLVAEIVQPETDKLLTNLK